MPYRLSCLLLILILAVTSAWAEVVVLRSGQRIKCEILLNNEEVIILRQKNGLRFQYPKTEVMSIQSDDPSSTPSNNSSTPTKTVAVRIGVAGGAAYIPQCGWGGTTDAQLMIGTHNLLNQHIFLGGGIGYRGVFAKDCAYAWIPIQMVMQMPIAFSATAHRPYIGTTFGYAFATNKKWGGGLCASVDIGYWYKINNTSSLSIALTAQWQQTHFDITETINQTNYTNHIGSNIVGLGAKIGIQF